MVSIETVYGISLSPTARSCYQREEVDATFSEITPMFLGGATKGSADVYKLVPAIRSQMRFWWRAMNWGERLNARVQGTRFVALRRSSRLGRAIVSGGGK